MTTSTISNLRTKCLIGVLACAGLASASHAVAQQDEQARVKVPFAFQNGSQHFPAGTYTIDLKSDHMMLIRGTPTSGFVMTNPDESLKAASQGKVIFRRYGDRYFVHEVWVSGSSTGHQCVKTREEKRVQIAQNTNAQSNVELALATLPR